MTVLLIWIMVCALSLSVIMGFMSLDLPRGPDREIFLILCAFFTGVGLTLLTMKAFVL